MPTNHRRPRHPLPARPILSTGIAIGALLAALAWSALVWSLSNHPAPAPALAQPPAPAPHPVVLVHGWQGLAARGFDCADGVLAYDEVSAPGDLSPRAGGEFGALAGRIAEDRDVFVARWTTSRSRTIRIEEAAGCLAAQIADVRERSGAASVDLVGHSMGGLVARAYVEGRAVGTGESAGGDSNAPSTTSPIPYRDDVTRIVTLGTPHTGVAPEILLRLYALFNLANARHGFLPCAADPGTCQMATNAMRAWNRSHPPNGRVEQALLAGARWTWTSWLLPGPDDGLITLPSSAAADTPLAEITEGAAFRVPEGHAAMFSSRHHYVDGRRTIPCVSGLLALPTAGACDERPARSLSTAGSPHMPRPGAAPVHGYGPLHLGEIGGETGQTPADALVATIPVDPEFGGAHAQRLSVAASWEAGVGRAALRLTAPDGRLVERDSVADVVAGSAYTEVLRPDGSGAVVLDLPGAPAGEWRAELRPVDEPDDGGGSSGAAVRAPAALFAVVAAPLHLSLDVERQGSTLYVWAQLERAGQPVDDALVELRREGQRGSHARGMAPGGNGRYWARLTGVDASAVVQLEATATGELAEGWRFARQATWLDPGVAGEPGPELEPRGRVWLPRVLR